MKLAFHQNLQNILGNMMGYVALPNILNKILQDHSGGCFWEYKDIVSGILENYTYEHTLLETTNRLLSDDRFTSIKELIHKRRKGLSPNLTKCGLFSFFFFFFFIDLS